MKILVTTMKLQEDKSIVSSQLLQEETDNIKHELIYLEPLPDKEGFQQIVVYDKASGSYKFEYEELPKTQDNLQEERIALLEKALSEALKDKKENLIVDELGEL